MPNTTAGVFSPVNKLDDIEFSNEENTENSQLKSQQLHKQYTSSIMLSILAIYRYLALKVDDLNSFLYLSYWRN